MNEHVTLVHPDGSDRSRDLVGIPGRSAQNCRCGWPKRRARARGPRTERGN